MRHRYKQVYLLICLILIAFGTFDLSLHIYTYENYAGEDQKTFFTFLFKLQFSLLKNANNNIIYGKTLLLNILL